MLVKKIKYTDYNDVEREEEFYFNLNKAEVMEWLTTSGNYTLDKVIGKLVRSENSKDIMGIFTDLIYRAYGEKSLDGRRFIKSKEIKDNFIETEAYSELFMELISDPKKSADFFTAIMPKDIGSELDKALADPDKLPDELKDYAKVINENTGNNVVAMPEK